MREVCFCVYPIRCIVFVRLLPANNEQDIGVSNEIVKHSSD